MKRTMIAWMEDVPGVLNRVASKSDRSHVVL